ncbi:hypothetical protein KUV57_12020 [Epibacterium sp. DP7N7-1]|nr:hypothetical protein [Epibacterium sp. DP7N7-1]
MGNLVTNRIHLRAEVGGIPEARIGEIVSALSGVPADEALTKIRNGKKDYGAWMPIKLAGIVPQPESLAAPVAWREENWGTRAHAEDGLYLITDSGAISLRFDTVNASPSGVIEALGAAFPELQLEAKGYDEDTDYAFSAMSDGAPGEVEWMEECDPDAVKDARDFVYPGLNETHDEEIEP